MKKLHHKTLIYIFPSINQQQKLIKKVTLTEMKKEIERQVAIEKKHGCKFIRINADVENYIFVEIGKIQNHIIESTEKWTKKFAKKSLIDKI